jgi:5'-nucleotidase
MRILVVNDDGIASDGIWALAGALHQAGLGEVRIVAPETEQSGTSMALPLHQDLTLRPVAPPDPAYAGIAAYAFNGTPVGCVLAGMLAGIGPRPDVVVSGINRGLNSGTNVLLSGTVGAAMFAALWGLPAIAVSQMFIGDALMPWSTATWATLRLFPLLELLRGHGPLVLNVNVPHLHDPAEVRGFRQTSLSSFFYGDVVEVDLEPPQPGDERQRLAVRFVRERMPEFPVTSDDGAVRAGYVSVTALAPTGAATLDLATALADL